MKDLQVSISYYIERLGFQLDFQGPDDGPYYAGVSRDGIGIMLKAIAHSSPSPIRFHYLPPGGWDTPRWSDRNGPAKIRRGHERE